MSTKQHDRWSLSLGRWGPLTVRIHIAYVLFVVFTLYLASSARTGGDTTWKFQTAWQAIGILTASVLLHELGHFLMIRRLGGICDCIVLWPFGSVASPRAWPSPRKGLFSMAAGPGVNLLACLFFLLLLWQIYRAPPSQLLSLFPSGDPTEGRVQAAIRMAAWINWLLFLVNLIPAYPFDGGPALQYLLAALWPELEQRQLRTIVGSTARVFAVGLLVLAVAVGFDAIGGGDSDGTVWMSLSLLAVFVFFSAKRWGDAGPVEEQDAADLPTPPSPSEPELEGQAPQVDLRGPLARWLDERREAARQRREQIEADEEERVDEILARLHESGFDGLSRDDRAILERVSARYRDRQNTR